MTRNHKRSDTARAEVPAHVAVIMDGNGRWARRRALPRHAGHRAGVRAARGIVEACSQAGVQVLTLFAFSSENWQRPRPEVSRLMALFMEALRREVAELHENRIRIDFIGERHTLTRSLQRQMARAETLTRDNTGLRLVVAVGYGGRWDCLQAARSLARDAQAGRIEPDAIDAGDLAERLSLAGFPDPDLFIRTGGERRISNFLLWNLAYTELYFSDILWPDFDAGEFQAALDFFAGRERRFGQTAEQVRAS